MASELPNPFQSPRGMEISPTPGDNWTFGDVLRQGFSLGHRTLVGAAWTFVLLAPIQVGASAVGIYMFESGVFDKLQTQKPGTPPPPELFGLMGFGCAVCVWMPIMLFGLPWIWGGFTGQQRDLLTQRVAGPFGQHGKSLYVTLLVMAVLVGLVALFVGIIAAVVQQLVMASGAAPGRPPNLEQIRELSRHPAVVATNLVTTLVLVALGTVVNLVAAAAATRRRGVMDSLTQGLSFCFKNFGSTFGLGFVYALLMLPMLIVQMLGNFVQLTMVLAIVNGLFVSIYGAYLFVINQGLASALYFARVERTSASFGS